MAYVIRWGQYGYVTRGQPNRKPYAQSPVDPETKTWKSMVTAERFLSLKDPLWAASCEILPAKVPNGT